MLENPVFGGIMGQLSGVLQPDSAAYRDPNAKSNIFLTYSVF